MDGEIFIASAWASSNLGYAYLSLRCGHLLVSRLYADRIGKGREDVIAMEADSEPLVDFEHMDTSSCPQQSRAVEGHSLMTRLNGHYDAIQEEAAQ